MTATSQWQAVDLGTKEGRSLDGFATLGQFFRFEALDKTRCLGVDIRDDVRSDVRRRGYQFACASALGPDEMPQNVVAKLWPNGLEKGPKVFDFPPAEYYIANHFLEHLPSIEHSCLVLRKMCEAATRGVWLVLPSFEQDRRTGEGALRQHGLRFTWTHWTGHPSHFLVQHAIDTVKLALDGRTSTFSIKENALINHTHDARVVPVHSPVDTLKYAPALGRRRKLSLVPPVVGEFELRVRIGPG